jgi:hypothetical protein
MRIPKGKKQFQVDGFSETRGRGMMKRTLWYVIGFALLLVGFI